MRVQNLKVKSEKRSILAYHFLLLSFYLFLYTFLLFLNRLNNSIHFLADLFIQWIGLVFFQGLARLGELPNRVHRLSLFPIQSTDGDP